MTYCGLHLPAAEGTTDRRASIASSRDIGDEQSIVENASTFSAHLRRLRAIISASAGRSFAGADRRNRERHGAGARRRARDRAARTPAGDRRARHRDDACDRTQTVRARDARLSQRQRALRRRDVRADLRARSGHAGAVAGVPARAHDGARPGDRRARRGAAVEQPARLRTRADRTGGDPLAVRPPNATRWRANASTSPNCRRTCAAASRRSSANGARWRRRSTNGSRAHCASSRANSSAGRASAGPRGRGSRQAQAALLGRVQADVRRDLGLTPQTAARRRGCGERASRPATAFSSRRSGGEGTVVDDYGDTVLVAIGSMRTVVPSAGCASCAPAKPPRRAKSGGGAQTLESAGGASPELDVRGKRFVEAEPLVDRWLDEAELLGLSPLRLIHGKGTGLLGRGLQQFLRDHADVAQRALRQRRRGRQRRHDPRVALVVAASRVDGRDSRTPPSAYRRLRSRRDRAPSCASGSARGVRSGSSSGSIRRRLTCTSATPSSCANCSSSSRAVTTSRS